LSITEAITTFFGVSEWIDLIIVRVVGKIGKPIVWDGTIPLVRPRMKSP
jgi:hypothetical protein